VYARVASFQNRDMSMADQLVDQVRERVRTGTDIPDAKGFLMLVDRRAGTALGISFFESEEAIRNAEPAFERMGQEIPKEMRGNRTSVDVYEVVIQEGGEGAKAARVSSLEGPPEGIDDAIRVADQQVLPKARQLSGWKGVISLVDRSSGRTKLITLWESEEALRASEEQAKKLRQETADSAGETIRGVDRYEVAVAERIAQLQAVR
jgi:heme-degrading monooxygenase HmoA